MNDDDYTDVITAFVESLLSLPIPAGERPGDFVMGVVANITAGVICNIVETGEEHKALAALTSETMDSIAKLIPQVEQYRASLS